VRPTLVEVPYDLGRAGVNGGAGASALAAALRDERFDHRVVSWDGEPRNEIAASIGVVQALAACVCDVAGAGGLPVVLAGNCHSCLGTVAGVGGDELGAVWLDAHADYNTPDSTTTGFFDGMALALLTGAGWPRLRERVEGLRPIPEERVVLIDARDADEGERARLAESRVLQASGLDDLGTALDSLRERVSSVYLHVDLDVLDPSAGRANPWAAEGGLRADELLQAVEAVGERFAIRAAAFTAYWPESDPDGAIPAIARAVLDRVLTARPVAA
jgi:arginase